MLLEQRFIICKHLRLKVTVMALKKPKSWDWDGPRLRKWFQETQTDNGLQEKKEREQPWAMSIRGVTEVVNMWPESTGDDWRVHKKERQAEGAGTQKVVCIWHCLVGSDGWHSQPGFVVIFFPSKGGTVTPPECLMDEVAVPAVRRKSPGGRARYEWCAGKLPVKSVRTPQTRFLPQQTGGRASEWISG